MALALSTRLGTGAPTGGAGPTRSSRSIPASPALWRRETLERHGGWDEEWLNDQDSELAARIRKAGGTIVCVPAMAAAYLPRDSLPGARPPVPPLRLLPRQDGACGIRRACAGRTCWRPGSCSPRPPRWRAARPVRVAARAGLAAYAAAVALEAVRAARSEPLADAASLPAVFATMHFAWGAGFLRGCAVLGIPWRALSGAASR